MFERTHNKPIAFQHLRAKTTKQLTKSKKQLTKNTERSKKKGNRVVLPNPQLLLLNGPPPMYGRNFDQVFGQLFDQGFMDTKIKSIGLLGRRNTVLQVYRDEKNTVLQFYRDGEKREKNHVLKIPYA